MSDEYYRQRAAQRGRRIFLIAGVVLVFVCAVAGAVRAFQDSCTASFERSPQAVIDSYVSAIKGGDSSNVANCWHHDQYYDPDTGCSEACLSKFTGTKFTVEEISFSEPRITNDKRTHIDVNLEIVCQESNQQHSAFITLDTVEQNYPWRHWHIVNSTLGGSIPELWCQ